ncbi:hypothetical protein [Roseovarius indicus]|uniref:hypothetical protein n=1 Tax=Roseovarius indicus TaxID=540747 RepID=UPI0032F08F77
MEQLLKHVPNSDDYMKIPYGPLAYLCFAGAIANIVLRLVEPAGPGALTLVMLALMMTTAGRNQMLPQELAERVRRGDTDDEILSFAANWQATTQHIRSLSTGAFLCALIALAASL